MILRSIVLLSIIALSSCSWFGSNAPTRDQNKAYLTAVNVEPLRIPPGVDSSQFESTYPVSNVTTVTTATPPILEPPGLLDK